MTFIQIEEGKMDKLSDHIEQSLRHMGKAMQCVEEWMEESGMGQREGGYGNRGGYGGRGGQGGSYGGRYGGGSMGSRYGERGGYGMRDEEDWEEYEEMGERRGVRGSGRGRR